MSRQLLWMVLFWGITIGVAKAQLLPAVQGIIQDSTGGALEAATVVLLALPDSTVNIYSLSDEQGGFSLRAKRGQYALQISYLGYTNVSIPLDLQKDTTLPIIILKALTDTLQLVEVTAEHIPVQMRGDTLSFNSAAFKVRTHDDAGALLRQLPGLMIEEDGTISFNGQKVTEILVDGKVFFGEDAQATLRTLSADAIKKIDITDTKVSSQGIEPEEEQKTINLRLKKKAKTGWSGNAGLGYGHIIPPTNTTPTLQNFGDHRYQSDVSTSYFTPNTRSAIYGRSYNVPPPNAFSMNSAAPSGITRTNAAGATFNWVPSTSTTWNNSYRYGRSTSTMVQESRELSALPELNFERNRERAQVNRPSNHNLNSNLTHALDTHHLIRIRLTASYQDSRNVSNRSERSFEEELLQNSLNQRYERIQQSYLLVPSVAFEKRFDKKGRQLIVNVGSKWSDRPSNSNNSAFTDLYDNVGNYTSTDTLLQEQDQISQQQNYNGSALWKEPFSKKDQLYITFKAGIERDQSRQTAFDLEDNTRRLNTSLSNSFERYYNYQSLLLSWRRKTKNYRLEITGGLKRSLLRGESATGNLRQELYLPTGQAQLRYTLAKGKKLIFSYNLYLTELSLQQLQPFVDNADPLAIQLGNTNLRPTVNHRLSARLDWFEQGNFTKVYTKLMSVLTPNTILQAQTIDEDLRVVYQPVNSTWSSNLGLRLGYNRLFQAMDIMVDVRADVNRGQRPLLLNGEKEEQLNYGYTLSCRLSNKKKKVFDWELNTRLNGGLFMYEKSQQVLNQYLNQYYGGQFGVEFLKRWEVKTNLGINVYTRPVADTDPTIILLSFAVKRRFLKNEQLEIELRAENLLNESLLLQRSQNAFVQIEERTQSLGRYVLLSLRYKFRRKG